MDSGDEEFVSSGFGKGKNKHTTLKSRKTNREKGGEG